MPGERADLVLLGDHLLIFAKISKTYLLKISNTYLLKISKTYLFGDFQNISFENFHPKIYEWTYVYTNSTYQKKK